MAALDFPSNPIDGQLFTQNGITYTYNSVVGGWLTKSASAPLVISGNTQVLFNDAGLANGSLGLVFDKTANTLFANTINVSSNMRVYGNLQVGVGTVTITDDAVVARSLFVINAAGHMTSVPSGTTSNLAFDTANAGFAKANAALANTTGTFTGNLTVAGSINTNNTITLTTVPNYRNTPYINANYTISNSFNEMSIGPIFIANNVTVTVDPDANWVIV